MTKIYKYQKVQDAYTTHCLVEPDIIYWKLRTGLPNFARLTE